MAGRHDLAEKLGDKGGPEFRRVPKWVEAIRSVLAHQFDLKPGRVFMAGRRRIRRPVFQRADGAGFFDDARRRLRKRKLSASGRSHGAGHAHTGGDASRGPFVRAP
jgi:hypothetical protein